MLQHLLVMYYYLLKTLLQVIIIRLLLSLDNNCYKYRQRERLDEINIGRDSQAEYIVEEKNGKKDYKIRGVFLQSDIKNRNGRIYEQDILAKEVNRYNREFIQKNRAFGELGHPDGPTVNLERVSHMITTLTPDGKNFMGEPKIMNTPYGKIVKSLIDEGAQLEYLQEVWVPGQKNG